MEEQRTLPTVTRDEWLWVATASVILLLLALLPIWYGYAAAPEGHTFSGLHNSFNYTSAIISIVNGKVVGEA